MKVTLWIVAPLCLAFVAWAILTDKDRAEPASLAIGKSPAQTTARAQPRNAGAIVPPSVFGPAPKPAPEPHWYFETQLLRKDHQSTLILVTLTTTRPFEAKPSVDQAVTDHRAAFVEFGPAFIAKWLEKKQVGCAIAPGGHSFAEDILAVRSDAGDVRVLRMSTPITCATGVATGIIEDTFDASEFRDALDALLKGPKEIRAAKETLVPSPKKPDASSPEEPATSPATN